jgi:hypothetical protein
VETAQALDGDDLAGLQAVEGVGNGVGWVLLDVAKSLLSSLYEREGRFVSPTLFPPLS